MVIGGNVAEHYQLFIFRRKIFKFVWNCVDLVLVWCRMWHGLWFISTRSNLRADIVKCREVWQHREENLYSAYNGAGRSCFVNFGDEQTKSRCEWCLALSL